MRSTISCAGRKGLVMAFAIVILVIFSLLQFCSEITAPEEFEAIWALKVGHLGAGAESEWVFPGSFVDVPILLDADSGVQIDSFNLKVAYNAGAMIFIKGEPGQVLDQWPEPTYGPKVYAVDTNLVGVIKMTGLNTAGSPSGQVGSYADSVELLKLRFWLYDSPKYECQYLPVRFYWENCRDNMIFCNSGHDIAISDKVFRINWINPSEPYVELLPEDGSVDEDDHIYGIFDICREESADADGKIDFYAGGIDVAPVIDPIYTYVGDIDLNGLHETVEDIYLLANYFIYGESVFTINRAKQLQACDRNRDGLFPTTADLQYMNTILTGDAIDFIHLEHFEDTVNVIIQEGTVLLESGIDLGATLFVFEGEVGFSALTRNFDIKSGFENGKTRIIFYSTDQAKFESGTTPVLQLAAPTSLKYCESTGYYGNMVVTRVID
ncbi:MAG: hypothetical protein GWN61_22440 [candidate division Zixibacteria bacterium]|nr:hypothetical protein [candidate division Zixibacteria bacterium]NIR67241.1 hypothetical protein [candidate division Zixibacteria bacterium]NIS16085.1 hypothetical protein [candidate division Zixibacteria bacterium]NIS48623.1 hypothetical protein [candidate division Zixibacteria bacterium]NIU16690.1 hypothetical protein [candidate division Zixibacteria bacterium]